MITMERRALLLGASGLIGNDLLHVLLGSTLYDQVKVLVRYPLSLSHPKLTQVLVDYDELAQYEEEFAVDDVYCCLGTTIGKAGTQARFRVVDHDYPLEAARLAKSKGAKQYLLVSAMGANAQSRVFYNRIKGEVEEGISRVGFVAFHIFRPSLLRGQRNELRFGEHVAGLISPLISPLFMGRLVKYKPIRAQIVAQAMAAAAQSKRSGQHVYEWVQMMELAQHKRAPQAAQTGN